MQIIMGKKGGFKINWDLMSLWILIFRLIEEQQRITSYSEEREEEENEISEKNGNKPR